MSRVWDSDVILELRGVSVDLPLPAARRRHLAALVSRLLTRRKNLNSLGSNLNYLPALRNVNLNLRRGEIVVLRGANGSGKTTLLKVIAGIMSPTKGIRQTRQSFFSYINIGALLDEDLTGRDNVISGLYRQGLKYTPSCDRLNKARELAKLGAFFDLPVSCYSSGMRMRLAVAITLTAPSENLVFDEWLSTGDSDYLNYITPILEDSLNKYNSIVIASHDETLASKLNARTIWLADGSIVGE